MSVGIILSEIVKKHDTGTHPENPKRIDSIIDYLKSKKLWNKLEKLDTKKISLENLYSVHSPDYVNHVLNFCSKGGGRIDEDTVTCPESYEIALISAGSVLNAVDNVFNGNFKKVFCIIRPPGHHALPDDSMGFCLFSNLALGVQYAINKYKLERVMVLDWDAHHGNGTERIFYNTNKVYTISWHQYPFWPFTGDIKDIGNGDGKGFNLNIPIPEGFTDEIFVETFENIVVPIINDYKPQMIFIASGYDAHYKDPLAGLNATTSLYSYLSKRISEISEKICEGKLIATLEGGYNLESLAEGTYATIEAMLYPDIKLNKDIAKEKKINKPRIIEIIDDIIKQQNLLKI